MVPRAEIEAVLLGELRVFPDPAHSATETRYPAIGRTPVGRYVLVAFTLRSRHGDVLIRPISARFMHQREIRHYEAQARKAPQAAETEHG